MSRKRGPRPGQMKEKRRKVAKPVHRKNRTVPKPDCPHPEKVHYRTGHAADRAIALVTLDNTTPPLNRYRCPCGGGWCLTSKKARN